MAKALQPTFYDNKNKLYVILILVPFCLYFKSLFYDFSPMDDQWIIVKNTETLSHWKNLPILFTKSLSGLYFRPMLITSFMLDFHIGKLSPYIYHFTNLILHILSVLLLFKLLKQFDVNTKLAFLLSLIFAVHPIALHSVAWIPGRNDSMLTVFALASVIFLNEFIKQKKIISLVWHFLFFICALLTKENAILLSLIYSVIYYKNFKFNKSHILLIVTWFVLLITWFFIRISVVNSSLSTGQGLGSSITNSILGYLLFIGKSTLPFQQSVFPTLQASSVIPGILITILFIVLYIKLGVKDKFIAWFGLFIFFSMLSIPIWHGASGTSHEHYEHRIYLSMIGLLLFVSQLNFNIHSKLFNYSILLFLILFSIKTYIRMDVYKNAESFVDAGIIEAPDNYFFFSKKAEYLYNSRNFSEAIFYYNKALAKQPRKIQLLNNRGNVYVAMGDKEKALADFNTAISISDSNATSYVNRCLAYEYFGDVDKAMMDLAKAKNINVNSVPPQLEAQITEKWILANAKYINPNIKTNKQLAIVLNQEIEANPRDPILYVNRAKLFIDNRLGNEALADLKKACELDPTNPEFKRYYTELNSTLPKK
jgi:tetratricopeptide (TPR) repeat protein